ncbi:MAG TPA: amidohydrolase family protein [Xanthomonadales bacterium]|nr:amidohydrolase family protein [Xanthomonadales bacterium]
MIRIFKTSLKLLLGLLVLSAALFLLGVCWPLATPVANSAPGQLLVTNVSVVDVRDGQARPGQNILIRNGTIVEVGALVQAIGPVQVVDATGKYAIPGLFDMHVHTYKLSPVLIHPLFVAAGVTAVRDMGGCLGIEDAWVACIEEKREWNRLVQQNRMVGPRFDQVTGLAINGGPEVPSGVDPAMGASTPEGARERVRYDKERGVDFLKPYSSLSRDAYLALAEEARIQGLYLAGHKPLSVSGHETTAAGQRSIEHAFLFIWECYPGMDELRKSSNPKSIYTHSARETMIREHDEGMCSELFDSMIEAGTAFVPTHSTRKLDAYALDPVYTGDARLKYIPGLLRMMWKGDAASMAERTTAEGQSSYMDFYRFGIDLTGQAHAAGVQVLAGTDAPDSYVFPGSGLHDELDHLVQAGLTPLDALRAATIEPAKFLKLEGSAGEIAPGARADLVLLDSNPLASIAAVRDIDSVILAGAAYDRKDLDQLLEGVENAAGHWSIWPKFMWQMLNSPIMRKQFAD